MGPINCAPNPTSVWNSDSSITQACASINMDIVTEKVWCCNWNMSVDSEDKRFQNKSFVSAIFIPAFFFRRVY